MKYLKLFESFNEEDIHTICEEYRIRNYTINEDGSIDVDGNVDLSCRKLTKLPLKFNKVNGDFYCRVNSLTSLFGCPNEVGGNFYCSDNKLKSLEHCPKKIHGGFSCYYNLITSLSGCPERINGDFNCSSNYLTSFEHCPKEIYGNFDCYNNKIISFDHLPFSIDGNFVCEYNLIYNIWKLFEDYSKIDLFNDCDPIREPNTIILDRLNFFLEKIGKPPVSEVEGYKCI